MKLNLTDLSIRSLKPDGSQRDFYCANLSNFGVRISQKGTKSFFFYGGVPRRRVTLGTFPELTLKAARRRALDLIDNPQPMGSMTFQEAYESYLRTYIKPKYRPKPAREFERLINKHCAELFSKPISQISHTKLEAIFAETTPSQANYLFGILRTFFRWAERRDLCTTPFRKLQRPHKDTSRDRVLSDRELQLIWRACEQNTGAAGSVEAAFKSSTSAYIGQGSRSSREEDVQFVASSALPHNRQGGQLEHRGEGADEFRVSLRANQTSKAAEKYGVLLQPSLPASFCTIVKLLILTGQRRTEIVSLQTSWVAKLDSSNAQSSSSSSPHTRSSLHTQRSPDLWQITFPKEVTKNKTEHTVPLSPIAVSLLQPCVATSADWLFQARAKNSPFNGWSKSKNALDQLSGVSNWTLHDLRRTFSTNMARLGVPPHVTEAILNHKTGTISPMPASTIATTSCRR